MAEHTDGDGNGKYRLVGDNHYHEGERLREGDVFEPTEAELENFGFKFEPVDEDAVQTATSESEQTAADDGGAEDDGDIPDDLESLDYTELQSLAGDYDDIKGNQPKGDLRDALAAKRDGE